jgi:hypothetical protein
MDKHKLLTLEGLSTYQQHNNSSNRLKSNPKTCYRNTEE